MFVRSLLIVALAIGLGAGSSPRIDSVSPPSPARSANPQTITVVGEDFQAGLRLDMTTPSGEQQAVQGDAIGARRPTSFQASLLFNAIGRYELVVTNTDGGKSPPFVVEVKAPVADAPVISRVTPAEVVKRPEAQALQVEGAKFATGLRAIVTDPAGADVTEAVVAKLTPNSFELSVRLDQTGDYSLMVSNPSGAVSNVFRIIVR
jgi:hypothetical protein